MIQSIKRILVLVISLALASTCFAKISIDPEIYRALISAMDVYRVPVVGYAIIKNYQIVALETLSIDSKIPVNDTSLFQAASISKSVSALGALKLVSEHKLNLDEPINNRLITWKIPDNQYTAF